LVIQTRAGVDFDVTDEIESVIADENVAGVLDGNRIEARGEGETKLTVKMGDLVSSIPIEVKSFADLSPVSFELDVQPILTSFGCNAGACHGKARGQNGFQLSLLGFDSDFDHNALTKHARGRRVFPAIASESLMLRKATAATPHGGGERFDKDSPQYDTLLRWIAGGTLRRVEDEPKLTSVELYPTSQVLSPSGRQRLLVTAKYSDGTSRDVTDMTSFQSNEAVIVAIDSKGIAKAGNLPGEATLMARYQGFIDTCNIAIPYSSPPPAEYYAKLPKANFIDELVYQKLASLGVSSSQPIDDAKFMRRVYLDLIGRLPSIDEARAFLVDTSAGKRGRLLDTLLKRPEYADHWASKWNDLLRPNPYRVGIKTVFNYDNWIRSSFRENKPYDQFVRELITAKGSAWRKGHSTLFRDRRAPDELTTMVSQLFLGIRLECAKCHHHPFESWSQDDFYSFAAYFAKVGRKGPGLSPPISGGEEIIFNRGTGDVTHPLTGSVLAARPLFELPQDGVATNAGTAVETVDNEDPREALADWMTSKSNPFFAQVMANRVWKEMMGRGIVEPVDDLRVTNPPTNAPLLKALGEYFQKNDYDIKALIRVIAESNVYSLSSLPTENNIGDRQLFSRHYRVRLSAEVLHDAIVDITHVPTSFGAMPEPSRANQIWTHRVGSIFLDTFGRPDPNQDPPCERLEQSTVTQALHLMNSPVLQKKFSSDSGWAKSLSETDLNNKEVAERLYLAIYGRFPSDAERQVVDGWLTREGTERRQATEDLMWALINSPEFFFKD
jgi:hypothetical protein